MPRQPLVAAMPVVGPDGRQLAPDQPVPDDWPDDVVADLLDAKVLTRAKKGR